MARTCPTCGALSRADAVFCHECGAKLTVDAPLVDPEQQCANCGAERVPGAAFCRSCAHAHTKAEDAPTAVLPSADTATPLDRATPPVADVQPSAGDADDGKRPRRTLIAAAFALLVVLLLGGVAAGLVSSTSSDDGPVAQSSSSSSETTTSTSTTTTPDTTTTTSTAPTPAAADFTGGWVVQYASVAVGDGEAELDRQLAEIRSMDREVTVIDSDDWSSFVPGYWVIVNTGPWSSGIEAAERCDVVGRASPGSCLGRFVSNDSGHRNVQCYRGDSGYFVSTCNFVEADGLPNGYDGRLLYETGWWLPGPSTVVYDVTTTETEDGAYTVEESFTLIIHEEGITEADLIQRLESPQSPWTIYERVPEDQSSRLGPGFGYERPCGYECLTGMTVRLRYPQGSEQLAAREEHGVTGPWVEVTVSISGV